MSLPSPLTLPSLPPSTVTQILDVLLEPTPSLHSLFLHLLHPLPPTYPALIASLERELLHLCAIVDQIEADPVKAAGSYASTDGKWVADGRMVQTIVDEVMNSHPRLGTPKPVEVKSGSDPSALSALSAAEQKAMNSASTSTSTPTPTTTTPTPAPSADSETAQLAHLNTAYEAAYPGLRFVTFVAGRPRGVIMEEIRGAIAKAGEAGAAAEERRKAVGAVCRIAEARVGVLGVGREAGKG
ncbi:hypothetical protein P152DRAFT_195725 [Eremomyces bilateralis CBS 781.70]|uniref:Oxo-4-hydroxy-4-carboxy-5-ureidoimidazoline decarboxylase domain-containing protein n=1 Tax=Eremomyces bilateralis CBS 781.70 TaxID=1392243 RepID=A0A6G1GCC2_9PEZI|nr:uncharacterized protein P152DRAFT_195725 [Eremomyces bilateralis CBS 781.70]KAF1815748.1 hypothetical protein P152DRAFT_195725 [Eremomyces bilateralis CBS 781.70]